MSSALSLRLHTGAVTTTYAFRYATTIHAINSCVIKLSKLAKAVKVHRSPLCLTLISNP